ncbi:MAG: UDP-N-acetylmuramoyl-L-alanine--D-glutamate ligase [Paracoccaceae bacterium]|nr:UDP-N-acetylmuramoyl-L-alanine--D-glutamate ligase [Paracoccaceae bacterium]
MIKAQRVKGQKIAVLGLGRTGLSVALSLIEGGAEVVGWDDDLSALHNAEQHGIPTQDLRRISDWSSIASLIVSPGISHLYPTPHLVIASALEHGVLIDNDIGVFFRSFATDDWHGFDIAPKVIAVTGSNGKSTTSALIHHILNEVGRPTQLAGNIGRGVMDLEPAVAGEVVVLELSSYQIELARALTPDIAVFINLSPDHLDRHGGEGGYFAAKRRLFVEGGPDRAIIGVDEIAGQYLANQMIEANHDDRVIRVSSGQKLIGAGWQVFAHKGFLAETRMRRQVASIDLRVMTGLPGLHNHQNAVAAYAACRAVGIAPKLIENAMSSFAGLPHRSQRVGECDGISFVNDSKATNVASALKALQSFKNIRWICGGLEKEGGLEALQGATGSVSKAYVIGREAARFAMQLGCDTMVCTTMEAAVNAAFQDATEGETILLAPAAASFDQYDNFEQRGEDFIAKAEGLMSR